MAYNNHMKGVDYVLRAVNDRLKFAIKILEGAVEGQVSVDGLVVANQLISEAIDKLNTCNNQKNQYDVDDMTSVCVDGIKKWLESEVTR